MADPQTNTPTGASPGRRARNAAEDVPAGADFERRSFAAPGAAQAASDEVVSAARELSQTAADVTRTAGERGRQATMDAATSWRGAVEPLMAMNVEINRWFDDLWRQATGFGVPGLRTARPFASFSAAPMFGLPPTDVKETEKAYVLCAELPGLTREDVDLQVRRDTLLISGQKGEAKEDACASYRVSERRFGRFERSFPIPPDADRDKIEAVFRDGVLTVTLPKTASAAEDSARIEIKA